MKKSSRPEGLVFQKNYIRLLAAAGHIMIDLSPKRFLIKMFTAKFQLKKKTDLYFKNGV